MEYLVRLLGDNEAQKVQQALSAGLPVLIAGRNGPTGKTTLAKELRQRGYNVMERWELDEQRKGNNSNNVAYVLVVLNRSL